MNDKITFPRLAAMLADRSGRSKRFSEDFLREFFALISEMLETGESVKVRGLGTFRLSRVEPRMSVDVTTGQPMEIAGHSKVVFVPAKELAEAVNAPFEAFTAIEIGDDVDIAQLFPDDEPALRGAAESLPTAADFDEDTEIQDDSETVAATAESIISFLIPEENAPQGKDRHEQQAAFDFSPSASAPLFMQDGDTYGQDNEPDDLSDEPDTETEDSIPTPIKYPGSTNSSSLRKTESTLIENAPDAEGSEDASAATNLASEAAAATFKVEIPTPEETTKGSGATASPEESADAIKKSEETSHQAVDDDEEEAEDTETAADAQDASDAQEAAAAETAVDNQEGADDNEDNYDNEDFIPTENHGRSRRRALMISFAAVLAALIGIFAVWYVFFKGEFMNTFNRTADATANTAEISGKGPGAVAEQSPAAVIPEAATSDSLSEKETEDVPTAPSDALLYDTISTTRYLTTMAKSHYGNYNLWPYIYEENKAILGHPDRIRPGTPVVIPDLKKYGVDASNPADIEKAKTMGMEIYARYGKKI